MMLTRTRRWTKVTRERRMRLDRMREARTWVARLTIRIGEAVERVSRGRGRRERVDEGELRSSRGETLGLE